MQTDQANKLDTELRFLQKLDALRAGVVRLKLLRAIHGRKLLAAELQNGELQREIERLRAASQDEELKEIEQMGPLKVRRRYRRMGAARTAAPPAGSAKRPPFGSKRKSIGGAESLAAQLEALRALLAERDAELAALRAAMADYQMQLKA